MVPKRRRLRICRLGAAVWGPDSPDGPEGPERPGHAGPTWFVRDKKSFVTLWADGHHDDHFAHLWCAGLPGAQATLVAAHPDRFFRPPYVGGRRWVRVRVGAAPPADSGGA